MLRQHSSLVLIDETAPSKSLSAVSMRAAASAGGYDEEWIRDLLFKHPEAIPVGEIDPLFGPLIPVCRELTCGDAGSADSLYINHLGLPTLVECKLWRNPEARRDVIGQILDYARVLRHWTYTDLQRQAAQARREQGGFSLFGLVAAHNPGLDETAFVDSVTKNLAHGRLLLLVIGDGIRAGVEAIAEYVQDHAGLHFTLGLVEAPVFEIGDGRRIIQPRVLAKTLIVNRTVVELTSSEMRIAETQNEDEEGSLNERQKWQKAFWSDLLQTLRLDDAEQPIPKPSPNSNIFFMFPTRGNIWINAYFSEKDNEIGVWLSMTRAAIQVGERLLSERDAIDKEIGINVDWDQTPDGRTQVTASKQFRVLRDPAQREEQLSWFRTTINAFVNAFRPRASGIWREIDTQRN